MNHASAAPGGETPIPFPPCAVQHLSDVRRRVLTTRQLRARGISPATIAARCRPGGPWQQLLPGIHLLHPGPPTGEELMHAALLYTLGRTAAPADRVPPARTISVRRDPGTPPAHALPTSPAPTLPAPPAPAAPTSAAPAPPSPTPAAPYRPYGPAMITGLAALALHHFSSAPPLSSLDQVDVLVPRTRRLRSTGFVRVVRGHALPEPENIAGVPTAPVARALADAVGRMADGAAVRELLTEAVRGAHCEAAAIVRELGRSRLLTRPQVANAVEPVLAEGRAVAEGRLYDMVRAYRLPQPLWNVALRLPGGPRLGGVDAYWPDQAVALELVMRPDRPGAEVPPPRIARKHEQLARLGITVVQVTPERLRQAPADQAAVIRTALMASDDLEPAGYVIVVPR